ncbi:DUF4350 domain-containing protein [Fredinandcohnia sp. 179-A 10B2 NHS]|uniref:DUF4350 domain-containing protein n=1 Tax=Fredinandcohnia sp. 179-A 10B2 NHS TaxID=3235176 RepID=UPI0039A0930A
MQKQSSRKIWMWLSGLVILFLLVSYFIQSYNPKSYPSYVSDSPSPTGVKALYTYLHDDYDVNRWTHSPDLLPKSNSQLLIMVEPYFTPEQEEMSAYQEFMEAGNTILLLKSNPKGMFDINALPVAIDFADNDDDKVRDMSGVEYSADVSSSVRIINADQDDIVLEDEYGIIAVSRSVGEGKLIVSITPEWVMNQNLLNYDHIPLVLSLLELDKYHTYLIDEYLHGDKNGATVFTLYPSWFLVLLLQGALLIILWLWYKGKRFGPVVVPREETVRFSDEGIRALSAWYLRGRYYHDSLTIQADYVKLLLQEKWGIAYHKEWTDIAPKLEQRWVTQKPSDIKTYLKDLTRVLTAENLSKQEYLLWSKKLDELRKEVEQG